VLFRLVGGRLAMADAVDLLHAEIDEAEAADISAELITLYAEVIQIGVERGKRQLTGEQARIATDMINEDIAKLERHQQDAERLRVFDGIPLGTPGAIEKVRKLSPDRYRAVIAMLMTPTVLPVGKGGKIFDENRLIPNWHAPAGRGLDLGGL
jgi:hypothetical protein